MFLSHSLIVVELNLKRGANEQMRVSLFCFDDNNEARGKRETVVNFVWRLNYHNKHCYIITSSRRTSPLPLLIGT